jgi:hypothetical protein
MEQSTKDQIKQSLTTFIQQQGFRSLDEDDETGTLDFYRDQGDKRQLLSVQFDTHGRPRFILEAGECSLQGVNYGGVWKPIDQVTVANLFLRVRLQSAQGSSTKNWFRADSLRDMFSPKNAVSRTLEEVQSSFPQLEEWFRTKKTGPNLYVLDMRSPGQSD